jgi:hypothetical protein
VSFPRRSHEKKEAERENRKGSSEEAVVRERSDKRKESEGKREREYKSGGSHLVTRNRRLDGTTRLFI